MPNLDEKLQAIADVVNLEVIDDVEAWKAHGDALASVLGLSAECMKEATEQLYQAKQYAVNHYEYSKLPPSVMLKAIDSRCAKEHSIYTYAEQLNRAIGKQLEFIRTKISFEKQERIDEFKARNFQS